jgi:transposase-like protein
VIEMKEQKESQRKLVVPNPEVNERPTRRVFTKEYKRRILEQAAEAKGVPGAMGALLRREGLYSSHLTEWRKAQERGSLAALAPRRRGPKPSQERKTAREVRRLERENARLTKELEQARLIIDVQKKLSQMLGLALPDEQSEK